MIDAAEITRRFSYYPPTDEFQRLHITVRHAVLSTAQHLADVLPECHEKAVAIEKLEEAMFWAQAAVERS
jgi:hypothetical protein